MFGMGFSEILIIAVIAILFLGPDKLPSTMVEIAKFFRGVKNTVGSVKQSLEEEMHVSEIKQEALAYKQELMQASTKLNAATQIDDILQLEEEAAAKKKAQPSPQPQSQEKQQEEKSSTPTTQEVSFKKQKVENV